MGNFVPRDMRGDWDITSQNTRCELAEGVAFDSRLFMSNELRSMVNDCIHEYLTSMFGPTTKD